MAFDFPAAPTEGQVFTPPGGPTYVYHAPAWLGAAPAPAPQAVETRNRLVNPAMQISQERGNTVIGVGYPADQWLHTFSLTGVQSAQRVQSPTPNGSLDRIQIKCTTAQASITAAQLAALLQTVEGKLVADLQWGTPNAKPIVVRFGLKAPAGTWTLSVRNQAATHSYLVPIVISAGQANTDTEQIVSIPGPTVGVWPDDDASSLVLGVVATAVGATYTGGSANAWIAGNFLAAPGQSNGVATVGNTFEVFDVGLYADPGNTKVPPAWDPPNANDELARCMRYWQTMYNLFSGNVTASGGYYALAVFNEQMRAGTASGVNSNNANFGATIGTLVQVANGVRELRAASATGTGLWTDTITVNART